MHKEFSTWLTSFRQTALASGIEADVLDQFESSAGFLDEVATRESSQSEFLLPVGRYIKRTVTRKRRKEGIAAHSRYGTVLTELENRFGVDAGILTAIWGVESSYGSVRGEFPVANALATLACVSARPKFFQRELIAALQIASSGVVALDRMLGSWAGAMGHTQLMPSSYLAHGQSFDGECYADIWCDDPADALASAASFLVAHGWQPGLYWGMRRTLPWDFDLMQTGLSVRRPIGEFMAEIIAPNFRAVRHGDCPSSIILPAGRRGPPFLVTENFDVLRRYNNSISYALSVGLLANLVTDQEYELPRWPIELFPLSRNEIHEMQKMLARLGYDTGGLDGLAGPATTRALQHFQRTAGLPPDGFASRRMLKLLRRVSRR